MLVLRRSQFVGSLPPDVRKDRCLMVQVVFYKTWIGKSSPRFLLLKQIDGLGS